MLKKIIFGAITAIIISSCGSNPYKETNKIYEKQLAELQKKLAEKEAIALKKVEANSSLDTLYTKQINTLKDSISKFNPTALENITTEFVGTVNFNLRKPNFVIIHHTAQDSLKQTLKTFTLASTKVSAHYVIAEDGKVVQMLNDYLRGWHAGNGIWGKTSDINSASIGIELDNNGSEPFSEAQINSLLALLTKLKKDYNIPAQNFIGHSDIAPTRKIDPSALFPWQLLAEKGFGVWPDALLETAPTDFNVEMALRIIGYDTKNLNAAIKAFKLHYIKTEIDSILDQKTVNVIYSIYKKQ
ncbi:N-acetylmuramoyl-L-alanine amidase [Flavobacterium sp. RSSA_27]|uniref:N-acetylmuramoyl-L-alanine amidase n=1 Tax=Flavobacterium sp. RSSA_27 TaxID=3447667 RepID=UPI003F2A786D